MPSTSDATAAGRVVPPRAADVRGSGVEVRAPARLPAPSEGPAHDDDYSAGTVAGPVVLQQTRPSKPEHVWAFDVAMPVNPDPELSFKPGKPKTPFVSTTTGSSNGYRLAVALTTGSAPVWFEGVPSGAKTSMVTHMARITNNGLARVTGHAMFSAEDLIGRWVGGEQIHTRAMLEKMDRPKLEGLAAMYMLDTKGLDEPSLVVEILDVEKKARFVEGILPYCARNGIWLNVDEALNIPTEEISRLLTVCDKLPDPMTGKPGKIILSEVDGREIPVDPNFRLIFTTNPFGTAGRNEKDVALLSRCAEVEAKPYTQRDLVQILNANYGDTLDPDSLKALAQAHLLISEKADRKEIGRSLGGLAFNTRHLIRAADRMVKYQNHSSLSNGQVAARELYEIYEGGIVDPADRAKVHAVLETIVGPFDPRSFYEDLTIEVVGDKLRIGDVELNRHDIDDPRVPKDLEVLETPRQKQYLYRLAKCKAQGENALLFGDRAAGKSLTLEYFAQLVGQPFIPHAMIGSTESAHLLGQYGAGKWIPGTIERAIDPPGVIHLEELNRAYADVIESLNQPLDQDRMLMLLGKAEQDRIRIPEETFITASANPPSAQYPSAKPLTEAHSSRYTVIAMEGPDAVEQGQIADWHEAHWDLPEGIASTLMALYDWVADGYEKSANGMMSPIGQGLRPKEMPVLSIRSLRDAMKTMKVMMNQPEPTEAFKLPWWADAGTDDEKAEILAMLNDPEAGPTRAFLSAVISRFASVPLGKNRTVEDVEKDEWKIISKAIALANG